MGCAPGVGSGYEWQYGSATLGILSVWRHFNLSFSLLLFIYSWHSFHGCIETPRCFFICLAECLSTQSSTPVVGYNRTTLSTPKLMYCVCECTLRKSIGWNSIVYTVVKKLHYDVCGVKVTSLQNALWDMFMMTFLVWKLFRDKMLREICLWWRLWCEGYFLTKMLCEICLGIMSVLVCWFMRMSMRAYPTRISVWKATHVFWINRTSFINHWETHVETHNQIFLFRVKTIQNGYCV